MKKLLTVLSIVLFYSVVSAEIITLKDGSVVKANIANQTESAVFVVDGTEWREIPRAEVVKIEPEENPRGQTLVQVLTDNADTVSDKIQMQEFIFKLGYDFSGRFKVSGDDLVTGDNLSAAFEYYYYFNKYLAVGGGISAQLPRYIEGISGRYGFAPAYLSLKVRSLPQKPYLYGYAVGQVGYNSFYSTGNFPPDALSGGIYYAGGLGVVIQNFLFELLYSVNSGAVKHKISSDTDIEYSKLTFSVGIVL